MKQSMIYDDAFRTMVEKTPELIIHLINEAFGTDYDPKEEFQQMRNEYMTPKGKVVTDSIFLIRGVTYHIECQAYDDESMAIRMVEYDFNIALEAATKVDTHRYRIKFPESCVLFIRKKRMNKKTVDVEVEFPGGEVVLYQAKAIPTLAYTLDEIFDRKLYALLPYYILKYEKGLDEIEASDEKRNALLDEYATIADRLISIMEANQDNGFVMVIVNLLTEIVDKKLADEPETKKGIGEIMGGKVLHLMYDDVIEEGRAKGFAEGRTEGRSEGRSEGMSQLANAIQELKAGASRDELLKKYDEQTVNLAIACR